MPHRRHSAVHCPRSLCAASATAAAPDRCWSWILLDHVHLIERICICECIVMVREVVVGRRGRGRRHLLGHRVEGATLGRHLRAGPQRRQRRRRRSRVDGRRQVRQRQTDADKRVDTQELMEDALGERASGAEAGCAERQRAATVVDESRRGQLTAQPAVRTPCNLLPSCSFSPVCPVCSLPPCLSACWCCRSPGRPLHRNNGVRARWVGRARPCGRKRRGEGRIEWGGPFAESGRTDDRSAISRASVCKCSH